MFRCLVVDLDMCSYKGRLRRSRMVCMVLSESFITISSRASRSSYLVLQKLHSVLKRVAFCHGSWQVCLRDRSLGQSQGWCRQQQGCYHTEALCGRLNYCSSFVPALCAMPLGKALQSTIQSTFSVLIVHVLASSATAEESATVNAVSV